VEATSQMVGKGRGPKLRKGRKNPKAEEEGPVRGEKEWG